MLLLSAAATWLSISLVAAVAWAESTSAARMAAPSSPRASAPLPLPLWIRVVAAPRLDADAADAAGGALALGPAIPVADRVSIDDAVAQLTPLFGDHGVSFVEARPRETIAARHADVITRDDRDAFAALLAPGVINVFVVRKLDDVDEPGRPRMGVTWRYLRDLEKKYVIVASYARPVVLSHELGHFLGNGHSKVKNNLMSYEHEEGARIFLDGAQGKMARDTARRLLSEKKLVSPAAQRPATAR